MRSVLWRSRSRAANLAWLIALIATSLIIGAMAKGVREDVTRRVDGERRNRGWPGVGADRHDRLSVA